MVSRRRGWLILHGSCYKLSKLGAALRLVTDAQHPQMRCRYGKPADLEECSMETLSRFNDQIVVITGASRGIGHGIALRFAQEGATLVVVANETQVHDVADEIKGTGQ